jgi:biotin carboxyl carrier protein
LGIVSDKWVEEVAPKVVVKTASTVLLIRSNIVKDVETISVWPQGASAPSALIDLARKALKEGRSVQQERFSKTSNVKTTLIAVPLSSKTAGSKSPTGQSLQIIGAIAMAMPTKSLAAAGLAQSPTNQHVQASSLESTRTRELQAALQEAKASLTAQAAQRDLTAGHLHLLALIHRHAKFESAANDFVSELAQRLGAERVSIGFIKDGHCKLVAISNIATLKNSAVLSRDLGLAMDEAIDQASTLVFPQPKGSDPRITLAHERFTTRHESAVLVSIPLLIQEDDQRSLVGAISAEFKSAAQVSAHHIEQLEQFTTVLGPVLESKRRASSSFANLFQSTLKGNHKSLLKPSNRRRLGLGLAALALLGLAIMPTQHRVTANARLEGATQRVMSAAVDGYIAAVHARPGMKISKGQPLLDLDDRDLQLDRKKLESEYSQVERKYGDALVKEDQTQIAIHQAKLQQLRAQVATVDEQLGRIKITSPFDGVVLSGDQSQSLGAPVKRGDVMMTIAPGDQYRLVVEVDERDISLISIKQSGHLVLSALPDKSLDIEVVRITPVAVVKDGMNVFEVEAQLKTRGQGKDSFVQPGLEGVAKIDTGSRSLAAVLSNRLRQWLNINLWKWTL